MENREIYTAEYVGIDVSHAAKRMSFVNVKNKEGELVKDSFWIKVKKVKATGWYDKIKKGEIITFSAERDDISTYHDGFKLHSPIILTVEEFRRSYE